MNPWVMSFVKSSVAYWPAAPNVLEVGSRNVNGSPRDALTGVPLASYVGVDIEPGPGVDICANAEELAMVDLPRVQFEVVMSTEMLEHVRGWREALFQMAVRTAPGGLLIATTRSPGFEYHPYPEDNWRFTVEHVRAMFSTDMWELLAIDTDPDPGQRGPAPFGYFGVGFVARRLNDNFTEWDATLSALSVAKP